MIQIVGFVWNQELVFWFWNQVFLKSSHFGSLLKFVVCMCYSFVGFFVYLSFLNDTDCKLCLESRNGV